MDIGKRTTLAILGGLGLLGSSSAFAHRRRREAMDPAEMEERIERAIKHIGVEVDATPEQQQKLTAIAKGAARDLAPLRAQGREMRQQGVALFTAPTIDKNAVEQLRVKRMQHADAVSKRITQALTESAEVLNPEQRKKAAARARRWRHLG